MYGWQYRGDGTSKEHFKIKCLEQYGSIGRNYDSLWHKSDFPNIKTRKNKTDKKKRRFLLLNLGACSFEGESPRLRVDVCRLVYILESVHLVY